MHDAARFDALPEDKRMTARGIEVGHIFYFGEKYSKPMKATVTGPDGREATVQMGSYGVGVSRLAGAIIEASHDAAGIIWPDSVAPFGAVVLNLRPGDAGCDAACQDAYRALTAAGLDPLYDDRDDRPGAKFAAADLVGIPWQLIVGPKGLAEGVVELKRRATGERQSLPLEAALKAITG
jgi:prolyl-tRNA synthetase